MSIETVTLLLPEIAVAVVAVWTFVGSTLTRGKAGWNWLACGGLLVAAWHLSMQTPVGDLVPPLRVDALAMYVRWTAIGVGLLLVLTSSRDAVRGLTGEIVGSLLLVLVGVMLVASAGDLVLLFVGLELVSIPTYVLLYLGRSDAGSNEATVKYFFLSILSSAIFLYGLSFLYGVSGSTSFVEIETRLASGAATNGRDAMFLAIAVVMVFTGLCFKIAAVPFQFYAPDVYQGASNAGAGLLAVVPKIAGIVALGRLIMAADPIGRPEGAWTIGPALAMAVALATMTLGNILALWQQNIRRLLAYSSIAHAGYMLIGLAVALSGTGNLAGAGASAMLFYLVVYVIATLGTFAALSYLDGQSKSLDSIDELAGLGRTRPGIAAAIALFMFSLAGLPPLAGFWGKLSLFSSAIVVAPIWAGADNADSIAGALPAPQHFADWFEWVFGSLSRGANWFLLLAIAGAINAAVAAAYYLRIVGVMYFRTPVATHQPQGGSGPRIAALVCAALVILVGVLPQSLATESERAGGALVPSHQQHRHGPGVPPHPHQHPHPHHHAHADD